MKKDFKMKLVGMLLVFALTMVNILPTVQTVVYAETEQATEESSTLFERVVTRFLVVGTLGLYGLIAIAAGQPISIETLIFNQYNKTNLKIFTGMPGSTERNEYITSGGIADRLNDVYSFFVKLAIIAYIMILVYIGIRILLNAGTDKNAKYKDFLVYWVQGIFILFMFPYVMKYAIVVNDAFVQFIYENKDISNSVGDMVQQPVLDAQGNMGITDIEAAMQNTRASLESGTDYMSIMFKEAMDKGWLVYGICWIIMVKQLFGLFIVYFKRLLITIFLIAVFPLVMISYAIDKLGDGKSQAFSNWCKEFVLNVFIQSFHAIAYVLCMALIVTIGKPGENWLLIVLVITFITKLDDILRNIFHMDGMGGKESTVQSAASTMLQAHAAVNLAMDAKDKVNNLVGKDSHVGHAMQGVGSLMSHTGDMAIARLDESNAQMDQAMEEQTHQMADLNAPMTLMDNAEVALNENATEEERNAALDQLNAIENMTDEAEKERIYAELEANLGSEQMGRLRDMMQLRRAMVTATQDVNFNEEIEVILERMRNAGGAAGLMAAGILSNPRNLNKLKMASTIKFRKPDENQSILSNLRGRRANHAAGAMLGGGTRRTGDRYSGVFRTPESFARMNEARAKVAPQPKKTFRQKMVGAGASVVGAGYAVQRRYKMMQTKSKARKDINKYEKSAMKDLRDLNKLQKEARALAKAGKTTSQRYKDIQATIRELNSSNGNISRLKKRRAEYAKKGVYFNGVGKTQRRLNAKSSIDKVGAKVGMVYRDATATFKENKEAKRVAKEARALREKVYLSAGEERKLKQYEKYIEGRSTLGSKIFANRAGTNGKVRMTSAQRMLNRDRNRVAVKVAREALSMRRSADEARARGNRALAEKFEQHATNMEKQVAATRKTTFRGYNPSEPRGMTRAQRILNRGSQKYAMNKLVEIRKKNPANLSDEERRILNNSNTTRRILREGGVRLTRASVAEKTFNKPMIRMAKKEERAAYRTMAGAEIRTMAQMVKDRASGNRNGDYTAPKAEKAAAAAFLRSRGAVIKGPSSSDKVQRVIQRYDDWSDGRKENRRARRDYKKTVRTANEALHGSRINQTRGIKAEINDAQKRLDEARKEISKSGTDLRKREKAKQKEEKAIRELTDLRKREQAVFKDLKVSHSKIRERGIPLSLAIAASTNIRMQNEIKKDVASRFERVSKAERTSKFERAERKYSEAMEHQERRDERANNAINLVQDTPMDNKIRSLADRKANQRMRKAASGATEKNSIAVKMMKLRDESSPDAIVHDSYSAERSALQSFMREERIHSSQGSLSRASEKLGKRFEAIANVPGNAWETVKDFGAATVETGAKAYAATTRGIAEIPNVPTRVSDAFSEATKSVRNTFGRVEDPNNPGKTLSLSEEVMQLARNRELDREKITINGMHTPPADSVPVSTMGIPLVVDTTAPKKSDSGPVLVVRDNPDSFARVTSIDDPFITLNTREEVEMATTMRKNAVTDENKISMQNQVRLDQLAYSVVAINQSSNGQYTASEVIAHIDNIRAIMNMMQPGTPEYDAMKNIVDGLKYNIDDYESNVRIQVLSDSSLVAKNDPRREQIMSSSIRHVNAMDDDDVLLQMSRFGAGGYDRADDSALQTTLEIAFRQRQREEQIEGAAKRYEASKAAIKHDFTNIVKESGGAVVDMAVRAPLTVGTGFLTAGMAGGKVGDLVSVTGTASTLGGYSLADKVYGKAEKFTTNRIKDVTSTASTVKDKFASTLKANNKNSGKKS